MDAEPSRGRRGRVLYVGQSYYHAWYLSRELRKLGWKADVLNWDPVEQNQVFYHGEDFRFRYFRNAKLHLLENLSFYLQSLYKYDIFHFSNAHGMHFGNALHAFCKRHFHEYSEVEMLKNLPGRRKIVYSRNGCLDGSSQTSFSQWGPHCTCDICKWRDVPTVCSDERNLSWGKLRNRLADYVVTVAESLSDYNLAPNVHDVPEFYCLDHNFWRPDLVVPPEYRLTLPAETVKVYHSVGYFQLRTLAEKNIKCTHIYRPLIDRLQREGLNVELLFLYDVPNKNVRYYQVQADIVVDMLTYGWFGANVREAMMLGKPAVCFLRPEWLESMRREMPDYVDELPVVSATPETVYDVLRNLIENPEKRKEIGLRSREFAVKWHSAVAAAKRFDRIYSELLSSG